MVDEKIIQRVISLHPLLRIARWHLDQIENTKTTTPELASLVVDHAIVATVFSAAAVERRLSDFLCSPILFMEEEGPRRFLGRLLTRYVLRLPARQKLQFLREQAPGIKGNPILPKLEDLFERRNRIVHTSYTYKEVLVLQDQVYDPRFHGNVPESSLTLRGSLHSAGPSGEAVEQAKGDYESAGDFIRTMWSVKPYQPWPPPWLERAAREGGYRSSRHVRAESRCP